MFDALKRPVEVVLSDGSTLLVEAKTIGEQEVAVTDHLPLADLTKIIGQLSTELATAARQALPDKFCIKFGLEAAIKSGRLMAMLVDGAAKGTIEVTLEWTNK